MTHFLFIFLFIVIKVLYNYCFCTTLRKNNKVKLGDIFVSKSQNNKRKQKNTCTDQTCPNFILFINIIFSISAVTQSTLYIFQTPQNIKEVFFILKSNF